MWRLFPRRIRAKSSLTDRLYVGSLPSKIFKKFWTKWRWSWTIRGNKTSNTHGIQACLHQTPTKRRSEGNLALVKFFSRANSLEGSEMNYGCRWPLSSAKQSASKISFFFGKKMLLLERKWHLKLPRSYLAWVLGSAKWISTLR